MSEVFIGGAVRTPAGKFGGALSGLTAPALGATAVCGANERAGIRASNIQLTIMGNARVDPPLMGIGPVPRFEIF